MKFIKFVTSIIFFATINFAQVIVTTPQFPTQTDSITIVFDAASAERDELVGYSGDLYAHTGVRSTSGNWQHVVGSWGVNSSQPKLTRIGVDLYRLVIGYPREFYNVTNNGEILLALNFVFRSADASLQTEDIFVDLYTSGVNVKIVEPFISPFFTDLNSNVDITVVSQKASIVSLYINSDLVKSSTDDTLKYSLTALDAGKTKITAVAIDSLTSKEAYDSLFFITKPELIIADPPVGTIPGINYTSINSVILCLEAPNKQFVYAFGDFSNWDFEPQYFMNKSQDGKYWWTEINNLTPQMEYSFQYLVDGEIRIGDPYSEKILDPWNDQYIESETYPNLKEYPHNKTTFPVSVLQTNKPDFNWEITNFEKPKVTDLVIYELLLRDFIEEHSFEKLLDSLDYIERLGINALQLMPVMEFEGNNSWGYNPMFMFAVDKYYGPEEDLKKLIDECHKRGIAVIFDIVLNHQFGLSPLVRLYSEGGEPSVENPWFNTVAKHPFNVGYDMNHESEETKYFVDRVTSYWIEEFKIDGYRFDLSKGFTQKNSGSDVGLWGQYDASRIALLKRMADKIWEIDSTSYLILEHFADNTEEKVLSEYGFMLWGNMNHEYNEATMGYSSNFNWASYKSRGWSDPNLVTYMESHDEERLMYKNIQYGAAFGDYSTKNLNTALSRMKTASAFFYTIPGPKMIWQFGELGYDFSINYPCLTSDCRLDPKPIKWDYYSDISRNNLFKVNKAIIDIKKEYDVFETSDYTLDVSGQIKRIQLNHETMNINVIGNFGVTENSINPNFQNTGKWYNFFSGDSMEVINTQENIILQPGEFYIYSTKKLPTPEPGILTSINNNSDENTIPNNFSLGQNYPNPFNPTTNIEYKLLSNEFVTLKIYDVLGKEIKSLVNDEKKAGTYKVTLDTSNLTSGVYFYILKAGDFTETKKMMFLK